MIIQRVKDGIKRSDIQKEYGISPSTLSRWICPSEKIINEVNGEFRPVLENYTDKGLDKDYDADIDAEKESDKSENESSKYEIILLYFWLIVLLRINSWLKFIIRSILTIS